VEREEAAKVAKEILHEVVCQKKKYRNNKPLKITGALNMVNTIPQLQLSLKLETFHKYPRIEKSLNDILAISNGITDIL